MIDAGLEASLGIIKASLRALPGGATAISSQDYAGSVAPTLSDALAGVPGVVLQDFFGGNDQPRIQIRGSGLQQNPVERGILVLRDGVPINRADGSYIAGFINPARQISWRFIAAIWPTGWGQRCSAARST
ncbi:TonB-dependent receptor plug domain-containing protein [Pseudorhizobium flavum]|uniref:Outer membrane receptor for Fe3+-dicitrate n=1 Tax=Pseudorhizobium flavum TaxID=1335061 RepID=A0A7W9Z0D8_9HYPH|nr:Plug domain-containing protein [Pseudorhizobium flavum]MBB6181612.1 outer membrane receptor for Fe3+-dicitrate [Pseudorhizobium flavum]